MSRPITERQRALIIEFSEQLRTALSMEKLPLYAVCEAAGVGLATPARLNSGKGVALGSILQMLDFIGYEMVVVKRKQRKAIEDDVDVSLKLQQYRDKYAAWKRKNRGVKDWPTKPPKGPPKPKPGPRVHQKKVRPAVYMEVLSRRESVEKFNEDNFLE